MKPSIPKVVALVASASLSLAQDQQDDPDYDNPCKSYGIDFQDKGAYFQNISSSDPFTFVSTFEGCQPDSANNILVDPQGDQYMCSDTSLTPDDVYQMSTCPLDKDQLWSGPWSVIIISNNGDAEPIAYMRDFSLNVGKPSTSVSTPVVTVTATITPTKDITSTLWDTESFTVTKTVTSPSLTKTTTKTITPQRTTITKTKVLATITWPAFKVQPTVVTNTKTLTCSVPKRQNHHDPKATITPTLVSAAALPPTSATPTSAAKKGNSRRRKDVVYRRNADIAQLLAEREARLADAQALDKRGLDVEVVTLTETNTALFSTQTVSTTTSSTLTITATVESTTSMTTITTSTTYKGVTKPVVTVTAPTPTKTKTKYTIAQTTVPVTLHPTITVSTKWAPASSTAICRAKGGKLV